MTVLSKMAVIPLLFFTGCATIVGGTSQVVAVDSTPSGATCEASRNGLRLHSGVTPMSFPIDKSYHAITISCVDALNRRATMIDKPGADPWVLGNVLIGGLIGVSIDLITGSINKYDTALAVDMASSPAVEPQGHAPVVASPAPMRPIPVAAGPALAPTRRELLVKVANDTAQSRGVTLLEVLAGGAGATAGLQSGDTIVGFNGAVISGTGDIERELSRVGPNSRVSAKIWRNDHEMPVVISF